eukprot:GILK01009450.1.p1 GENE.GILK01009450.1~~GILK01009450.1.p1  ORF type:complete len:440 (+),score=55.40 GILK01009450.1:1-1320(+)
MGDSFRGKMKLHDSVIARYLYDDESESSESSDSEFEAKWTASATRRLQRYKDAMQNYFMNGHRKRRSRSKDGSTSSDDDTSDEDSDHESYGDASSPSTHALSVSRHSMSKGGSTKINDGIKDLPMVSSPVFKVFTDLFASHMNSSNGDSAAYTAHTDNSFPNSPKDLRSHATRERTEVDRSRHARDDPELLSFMERLHNQKLSPTNTHTSRVHFSLSEPPRRAQRSPQTVSLSPSPQQDTYSGTYSYPAYNELGKKPSVTVHEDRHNGNVDRWVRAWREGQTPSPDKYDKRFKSDKSNKYGENRYDPSDASYGFSRSNTPQPRSPLTLLHLQSTGTKRSYRPRPLEKLQSSRTGQNDVAEFTFGNGKKPTPTVNRRTKLGIFESSDDAYNKQRLAKFTFDDQFQERHRVAKDVHDFFAKTVNRLSGLRSDRTSSSSHDG